MPDKLFIPSSVKSINTNKSRITPFQSLDLVLDVSMNIIFPCVHLETE